MKKITIAIDGPAASGKSSVAKIIAKKLNYTYLDTGAMYRAMAFYGTINFPELNNENYLDANDDIEIGFADEDIVLNGKVVTNEIRVNEISSLASKVASFPAVREKLTKIQQDMAKQKAIVIDGRDIGTVIAPGAELKIFLTATPEARATRRINDPKNQETLDYDQIVKEIKQRDHDDMTREIAPLKQAEDAIYIDNSDWDLNKTVEYIENLALQTIEKED